MAENIGGTNPFSSAGHEWVWGPREVASKVIGAAGVAGVARSVIALGGRPGMVVGRLKGTGATAALARTALVALEATLEGYVEDGTARTWADTDGATGSSLVCASLERVGPREVSLTGSTYAAWQSYRLTVLELDGAP